MIKWIFFYTILFGFLFFGTVAYLQKGDDVRNDDWFKTCTLGEILK